MVELERAEALRPAEVGARLVALRQLEEALRAIARAGHPDDEDAVHDARVALRRLRSTLGAYRPLFDRDAAAHSLTRAGRLAGQMGGARDTEVWHAWIQEKREAARGRRRAVLDGLAAELEARLRLERGRAVEGLGDRFLELERELRASLRTYEAPVTASDEPAGPTFALAASDALRAAAGELERALADVRGAGDAAQEHAARIAAKRMRYVLEPLRTLVDGAPQALAQLRRLQDLLGERHDREGLAELLRGSLERAALATAQGLFSALRDRDAHSDRALRARVRENALLELLRAVRDEGEAHWAELSDEWLFGKNAAFFARIGELADGLRRLGTPPQEIERKYLLRDLPERVRGAEAVEIEQGYLPGGVVRERLRRAVGPRGARLTRTVKLGTGVVRAEFEEEISEHEFDRLWPLTDGARLRKRRYRVPAGALVWEIDAFADRPLWLAEVELPTEDTPVSIPEWLEPYLVREVTGDPDFSNLRIAQTRVPAPVPD
ncbi:MAG TPA: CHAD domain-containing protein [Myxococcota bacterium]|nr:CHAD domain-containing protein [Myxococcota bacterium]